MRQKFLGGALDHLEVTEGLEPDPGQMVSGDALSVWRMDGGCVFRARYIV